MKLALGTVQFGINYGIANKTGQVSRKEAGSILDVAYRNGIDMLDTAIAYGDSERQLGEIGIQKWRVITKIPSCSSNHSNVYAWVIDQFHESLRRLRVDSIYALLLHCPDQLFEPSGYALLAALRDLKRQGYLTKIGISVYEPEELGRLFDLYPFDIIQAPLNILDRRLVDSGWALRLHRDGVEIHTRSSFLQGLLLMNDSARPKKFNRWNGIWEAWAGWLKLNSLTPLQACILYSLSIVEVDKVIVGVDSTKHLEEILLATKLDLPNLPYWPIDPGSDLLNPSKWSHL